MWFLQIFNGFSALTALLFWRLLIIATIASLLVELKEKVVLILKCFLIFTMQGWVLNFDTILPTRQHILCAVLKKIHTNRGNQLNCAETDSLSVFNEHHLRICYHMLFREVWFALFPEGFWSLWTESGIEIIKFCLSI